MAKKEDIERLFAETKKIFGRLDILVNNAGIYEFSPLEGITEEHFHKHFNLNVLGLLLASQQAVRYFDSSGGCIINISSVASTYAPANTSVYSATKGAVDAITRVLSKELGPRKIRVNSINPGMVETEGVHAAGVIGSDFQKQTEARTPLGPNRSAAGYRSHCRFSRLTGCRMDNRRNNSGFGRLSLIR